MIVAVDHAPPAKVTSIRSSERLRRPLWRREGVFVPGEVHLVTLDALRLSTGGHHPTVFGLPQAITLESTHELSVFCDGTTHRKKTSYGFVASAKRKRLTSAEGRYCLASSSTIKCNVSCF